MNKKLYTRKQAAQYKKIIDGLSTDELIGQLMCVNISASTTPEFFEEYCQRRKPGSIFVMRRTGEEVKTFLEIANR